MRELRKTYFMNGDSLVTFSTADVPAYIANTTEKAKLSMGALSETRYIKKSASPFGAYTVTFDLKPFFEMKLLTLQENNSQELFNFDYFDNAFINVVLTTYHSDGSEQPNALKFYFIYGSQHIIDDFTKSREVLYSEYAKIDVPAVVTTKVPSEVTSPKQRAVIQAMLGNGKTLYSYRRTHGVEGSPKNLFRLYKDDGSGNFIAYNCTSNFERGIIRIKNFSEYYADILIEIKISLKKGVKYRFSSFDRFGGIFDHIVIRFTSGDNRFVDTTTTIGTEFSKYEYEFTPKLDVNPTDYTRVNFYCYPFKSKNPNGFFEIKNIMLTEVTSDKEVPYVLNDEDAKIYNRTNFATLPLSPAALTRTHLDTLITNQDINPNLDCITLKFYDVKNLTRIDIAEPTTQEIKMQPSACDGVPFEWLDHKGTIHTHEFKRGKQTNTIKSNNEITFDNKRFDPLEPVTNTTRDREVDVNLEFSSGLITDTMMADVATILETTTARMLLCDVWCEVLIVDDTYTDDGKSFKQIVFKARLAKISL